MRSMKLFCWIVELSIIVGAMASTPAVAQVTNQSDTGGTQTTGQTDLLYGFEPLINKPIISASLKEIISTTNKLVSNGQTQTVRTVGQDTANTIKSFTDRVGNNPNGALISTETKAALLSLSRHLQDIEQGLWAYGNGLNLAVESSAQGLLKDLNAANKGCQANPSSCGQLKSLVTSTSDFVQKLKAFETMLHKQVQKARIY